MEFHPGAEQKKGLAQNKLLKAVKDSASLGVFAEIQKQLVIALMFRASKTLRAVRSLQVATRNVHDGQPSSKTSCATSKSVNNLVQFINVTKEASLVA